VAARTADAVVYADAVIEVDEAARCVAAHSDCGQRRHYGKIELRACDLIKVVREGG
jgi:hypothetical protein